MLGILFLIAAKTPYHSLTLKKANGRRTLVITPVIASQAAIQWILVHTVWQYEQFCFALYASSVVLLCFSVVSQQLLLRKISRL
jgi:hypothetical protein